ncbi:MAG: hypothetical protein P1P87_10390 [Trueperaceae bacterium]|nr:hypothetical protein [Trueperaceae bacterium]
MRERTFWRTTAWALAVLLLGLVAARASGAIPVPPEAIALTASTLFCLGVGRTVASPRSSLVRLDAATERAVRRRQVGAGLVISAALALLLLVPEVRHGPTPWVLAPVIALRPVLAVREVLPHAPHDAPERRP